jgi:hypothetical protein
MSDFDQIKSMHVYKVKILRMHKLSTQLIITTLFIYLFIYLFIHFRKILPVEELVHVGNRKCVWNTRLVMVVIHVMLISEINVYYMLTCFNMLKPSGNVGIINASYIADLYKIAF